MFRQSPSNGTQLQHGHGLALAIHESSPAYAIGKAGAHDEVEAAVVGADERYQVQQPHGSEARQQAKDEDGPSQDEGPLSA